MTEATDRDSAIIANQERRIARLAAEVALLEDREQQLDTLVEMRFNPPDDDAGDSLSVIGGVATFIESLPCECTPEQIEDYDACARCRVLGRRGDKAVER
jgi:hypothetical protein